MAFSGKVVLVTGAASGIGAATAELFAREGAQVVAVDRDAGGLREVAGRCAGGRAPLQLVADVADDGDANGVINETIAKCGKLDVLVNCAGILRHGSLLGGNLLEAYDQMIKVNLRAVILLTSLATVHLVSSKGNIVNIASIGAQRALDPIYIAYCVSKAGVHNFTRGAALELATHGVRVNSISPGATNTNLNINSDKEFDFNTFADKTALRRISQPEEIADLVLYLASEKAKGVTGSDFVIDCGLLLK